MALSSEPFHISYSVAVELVGAGLGEVVDLRRAVAALIDGIGVGVDGGLLQRVEADDEVGGEADVQAEERIVGVEAVEDVAVRGRGQAVELDVAIAAGGLGVVRRAGRVHQRALGELRDVGEVLARVGQVLDGLRVERGGGVGVLKAHQPGLRGHFDRLRGCCGRQREVDQRGLAHRDTRRLRPAEAETLGMDFNPVGSRVHL